MNATLTLIASILTTVEASFSSSQTIGKIAGWIAQILTSSADIDYELQHLNAEIQQMIDTGTEPTDENWAEWRGRSDAAHLIIQKSGDPPKYAATDTHLDDPVPEGEDTK